MRAITIPVPEPIAPPAVPHVEPGTDWSIRPMVVAGVIVALAVGAFAAWRSLGGSPPAMSPTTHADLETTLEWMFDATLTHQAATSEGAAVSAPFRSIHVSDVDVVDPLIGPILATAVGTEHDGTNRALTYQIDVIRRGTGWTISATPIERAPVTATSGEAPAGPPQTAPPLGAAVSPGGS